MKQKCAFFDFDYTIAHGDSIRKLLSYTLKKWNWLCITYLFYGINEIMGSFPFRFTH